MCGRIDQNQTARFYASTFGWLDAVYESQSEPHYNVSPGTFRPVMHIEKGERRVDDVYWSYRPAWAAKAPAPGRKKIPIAVNAKVEKLMGAYWKPLMREGRAIVGASAWYEWTGPKGAKQPWHIHRKDGEPIFILALANFGPAGEHREATGFVLVTADSEGGMVDIHDRRPVVVSAADAQRWLDPDTSPEQAAELARTAALATDMFEWHQVSTEVNRAVTNGPQLLVPINN